MRNLYQFIIIALCGLASVNAQAWTLFADALYWRATENNDWVYNNSLTTPNQIIAYRPISFPNQPGFRIGVDNENNFDTRFYYTHYNTSTSDSATGNLVSAFLASKFVQLAPVFFYNTGQMNAAIHFNMLDLDMGKRFYVANRWIFKPIVGIEGGWINQLINVNFQGFYNVSEYIQNKFSGLGPKIGLDTQFNIVNMNNYNCNLAADFAVVYLLGHWIISDTLNDNKPETINVDLKNRNQGALGFHGLAGLTIEHKNLSAKFGYEINDYFNQFQIMDDETGPHNNDLVLQGWTLEVRYDLA